MRDTADGSLKVRANPATGEIGFVRTAGANADLLPGKAADSRAEAAAKADAYLDQFAQGFGASRGQLVRDEVFADQYGWSITYTQSHRGVPVFAAELKARVDRDGDLTAVNGFVAPDLDLGVTPAVTEGEARDRALTMVRERPAGHGHADDTDEQEESHEVAGLEVRSADLMIYRMGSTRGIQGEAKLAWVLEVWNQADIREAVILDALTGKWLNRWSMTGHALDRELYEGSYDPADLVWSEGDEFPADLDEDQQNEVLGTSESYWMFMNTFGYDAWDGAGGKMITVNNDPTISCPNANWNGVTTNYCSGVTGDDTVAHEWAHAYTESTSGLIYQWQSGAMNEAYSDIWGETVDMLNTRHNEGGETPDDTVLRTPDTCSEHQVAPYDLTVTIDAPAEIAGACTAAPGFGPDLPAEPITASVHVGVDDNTSGSTTDGCAPFTNTGQIAGNWVYVDRGACSFQVKSDNATVAGAEGLIVGNNTTGLLNMAGEGTIYTLMVAQGDGARIKSVEGPVTMTIHKDTSNYTDDTYRWLSGESDPAFGGAIRDMWNPNCYGDPGQVSDAEYHCSTDDSGGVHTNSGVVNRLFAIMVDGYEPSGVTPIGLDKAANLFWRAQTTYLTPTSGFPELADALEASCTDLTGQPVNRITLGNPAEADGSDGAATPEVIANGLTTADCTAVTAAIAEVELRKEPAQCNFLPMLEKGELSCGKGFETVETWSEDFEEGLEGWTQDHEFGNYAGVGFPELGGAVEHPWVTTTDQPLTTPLPGDAGTREPSTLAFAVDPTTGSCAGDAEDESARNGLISPEITVPEGFQPRMSFDHLMASEAGWDGGNVKVSVNGGEFIEIPSQAWLLNAPHGEILPATDGNSNPLAGQSAFTGTDGGEVTGSWGTSAVSLGRLGATPGDTVQFRFDFGRDGCNGVEGWYVDDITVSICEEIEEPAPTTTTVTSVKPKVVEKGKSFKVTVKVSSADAVPTGKVLIKKGATILRGATLNDAGVAVMTVSTRTRLFRPGRTYTLVASYLGKASFAPSKDSFTVKVVR